MTARTDGTRLPLADAVGADVRRTTGAQALTDAGNQPRADATRLLTAAQVAERWQVRTKQVYALVNRGDVPCIRIGRYRRFRLEAVEAWERAQEGAI